LAHQQERWNSVRSPRSTAAISAGISIVIALSLALAVWGSMAHAQQRSEAASPRSGAEPAPAEQGETSGEQDSPDAALSPRVGQSGALSRQTLLSDYVTVPDDFPPITVTVSLPGTGDGHIFLAPYNRRRQGSPYSPYLVIVDEMGELVYHKKVPAAAEDFKKQPTGMLSYTIGGSYTHQIMDESYGIVDSVTAAGGFLADFHDFQIVPDGHMLVIIYEPRQIDMSQIVEGGDPNATVTGCRIQELDESHEAVFEWSSFDHFAISDTNKSLLGANIDYVHCNSIEQDSDGHLLLSSRAMNEVTKIDAQTGEIIWRWGGKNNQFEWVNGIGAEDVEFVKQHDARRVANGNITLFDNRLGAEVRYSRAVEYHLDEVNKVATLVWEYRNDPTIFARILANAQRLPNGNTLIGWGSGRPSVSEVTPDGRKVFELALPPQMQSYRAFRFPWVGRPDGEPTLIVHTEAPTTTLTYSWNGATDVAAYRVYGDTSDFPSHLITVQPVAGFETTTVITDMVDGPYNFRVVPLDRCGRSMIPSSGEPPNLDTCPLYLPLMRSAAP
jgi:hypothetical protein